MSKSIISGLLLSLTGIAHAAPSVVIGTGGIHTVTETHEVLIGSFAGVVVARNGVQVNMAQATIDCSSALAPTIGLHLPPGRGRVHVNGGIIRNCNTGVLLGDTRVSGPPAGSKNLIDGVTIEGALVTRGSDFDGDAITINSGVGNVIKGSNVLGYHPIGIRIFKGSKNAVTSNTVRDTTGQNDGFDFALLLQNAEGIVVLDNYLYRNQGVGLTVYPVLNGQRLPNIIRNNTALENGVKDVRDDTSPCANFWKFNYFVTSAEASSGCVQ